VNEIVKRTGKLQTMGRFIHTFRCGEVGMQGTRRVLEGGRFTIGGARGSKHMTERRVYADPLLVPYVGQIIYFVDNDDREGRISVYEVTFDVGKPGTRGTNRNRSVTGKFVCYARQEEKVL
jgi:hypothetical protein